MYSYEVQRIIADGITQYVQSRVNGASPRLAFLEGCAAFHYQAYLFISRALERERGMHRFFDFGAAHAGCGGGAAAAQSPPPAPSAPEFPELHLLIFRRRQSLANDEGTTR